MKAVLLVRQHLGVPKGVAHTTADQPQGDTELKNML